MCHAYAQEVLTQLEYKLQRIRRQIFKLEQDIADADDALPAGNEDKVLMLLDMLLGRR